MDTPESNKHHHDRSRCFWYSDVHAAGDVLANAATAYPPSEWLNFIDDATLAAKALLPTPTPADGGDKLKSEP